MRQGMMGADVDTSPAAAQPMELKVSAEKFQTIYKILKNKKEINYTIKCTTI